MSLAVVFDEHNVVAKMFINGVEKRAPVGRDRKPAGYDVVHTEFHNLLPSS